MAEARAALQQAFAAALYAPSADERDRAAQELVERLDQFVRIEPIQDPPDLRGAVGATRRILGGQPTPLSCMTDAELQALNSLLPWAALTVDTSGRPVGQAFSPGKRSRAHVLLDKRQVAFDQEFPLSGRHVVEIGCFEGVQTLGLLLLGARVTAVDGRVENVLKTLARVWAYGRSCDVRLWDVETPPRADMPDSWAVLHHVGVLYHLAQPVEHLDMVLPRTSGAVLMDTHVADDETIANHSYEVDGRTYRYRRKPEPYAAVSPFAGIKDHAKYLLLEDLTDIFRRHGFGDVRLVNDRAERNGRRVLVWAFR